MEDFEIKDCSPNDLKYGDIKDILNKSIEEIKDILNRRLEDGERVYLSEVYEMLGIERSAFNQDADHIFWQKVDGKTKLMTQEANRRFVNGLENVDGVIYDKI